MRKVIIGAPSLTGKDANDVVGEAFKSAKFPLTVKVINHMPRQVVFPVAGLFLGHVCDEEKSCATVVIDSFEHLQTLTTDVEQIAELNRYEEALTVEEIEKPKGKAKASDKASDKASADATGQGEESAQAEESKSAGEPTAADSNQQNES